MKTNKVIKNGKKQLETESIPQSARFDLSIGINEENWQLLKRQGMSDEDMEKHLLKDVDHAIGSLHTQDKYDKERLSLIGCGVVDISLTKYY